MANLLIKDSLSLGLELLNKNGPFIPFKEGQKVFWRDENQSITYQQLKEDALSYCYYLQSLNLNLKRYQLIVETKGIKNFSQILGGLLAQAQIYLVADFKKFQNDFANPLFFPEENRPHHTFSNEKIPSFLGTLFFQTSGSTSFPKWISFSGKEIETTAFFQNEVLKEKNLNVYALALPWHHVAGFMLLWRAFILSKTVVSKKGKEVLSFDAISLVPYQLKKMMAYSHEREQLLKCQAILLGGDHIPLDLKEMAKSANLPIYISYGLTETLGYVLLFDLRQSKSLYTPGFSLTKSLDNEILIENIQGKIISTGDIAETNGPEITIIGRKTFSFKFHGEWVNPEVIESLASQNPKVINALCLGTPAPSLYLATTAKNKEEWDTITKEVSLIFLNSHLKYYPKIINPWPWHIPLPLKKKSKYLRQQMAIFKETIDSKKDFFLLLGGTFSSNSDWDELKSALPAISFIIPPVPYEQAQSLTKEEILNIFIFTYSFLIERPCHFIGYSLGGRIILEIYNKEKSFFKSLILISAHPGLTGPRDRAKRIENDEKILSDLTEEKNLEKFFNDWYHLPIFGNISERPNYQKLIAKRCHVDNFYDWLNYWKKIISIFSLGKQDFILPQSIPVLYICGEEDKKYCELSLIFKSHNAQTKIVVQKNSGHAILEENGPELIKEILSFI